MKFISAIAVLCSAAYAADTGFAGTLSSLDGGLGGTVKVANDSALVISDYKLKDASAPALYWWGSESDKLSSGFRISNAHITKPASSDSYTIELDNGKKPSDFSVVGLWCEKLNANFGQATLTKDGGDSTSMDMKTDKTGSGDDKSLAATNQAVDKMAIVVSLVFAMALL